MCQLLIVSCLLIRSRAASTQCRQPARLSRKLGLTNEAQFIRWRRGHLKHRIKCPIDMPMHPDRVYPEFDDWPDFLGFTPITWLPFDQARRFIHRLKLRNQKDYRDWVTG